ncbi:MAG: hypothetical protein L0L36_09590 [Brevibacterium sp.]|nr:hypothetical protein [Brevibacterium sp.]
MTTPRSAWRHHHELGRVLAVYSDRPGPLTVGVFAALWVVFTGLTFINPGETVALMIAPGLAFGATFALVLIALSGERVIVCERGLLIGSVTPGLRPYVIPYAQIVLGSLVPVSHAERYGRETATGSAPSSTVRRSWWTRGGIHFVAIDPQQARRHRALFAPMQDPPPRSIDGRWVWFAGTGTTPPEQVTAALARAAGANGCEELAQATASARVRELSGNPADASAHLPGFP